MSRDDAHLLDVHQAARLIIEFTEGHKLGTFRADQRTQSAILHQLTVLGEAVKRISADFRGRHPEIPWRDIAGMRDRLVHGYDRVDLAEVWRVAEEDVPRLSQQLAPLLPLPPESA
jgi:uncharacterized protein with HEPN domain